MVINMYNHFKSGNYKKKNPLFEIEDIEPEIEFTITLLVWFYRLLDQDRCPSLFA